MTGKRLGVGIVGANWAARGHLPGWRMLPGGVDVRGIATRRAKTARAAADRLGLPRAYAGFAEMLADPDVDIVSLGGPPPARVGMTLAALAAGKHVYTCIPFAVTVEQADAMAARQRDAGLAGAVDAYFRWTPGLSAMAAMIDAGELGELYAVNIDLDMAQFVMPQSDYPYLWTGKAENGTGVFENSCAHLLHLVREMFGPVSELVADAAIVKKVWTLETGEDIVPEVPDTANVIGRLANGALFGIRAGRAVPSGEGFTLTAYGAKARLTARSPAYPLDGTVRLALGRLAPVTCVDEIAVPVADRFFEVPGGLPAAQATAPVAVSLGRQFAAMLAAIDNEGECAPSFSRAAEVQRLVSALARSARERRWIGAGEWMQ